MTDTALSIAVDFIARHEGFRASPYQDSGAGVWTIGYGFTYLENGQRVTPRTPPMTEEAARARLSSMVSRVLDLVRGMVHVAATDQQLAALTSFAFNEGTAQLRNSSIMKLFNQGKPEEAAKWFHSYVYAGGHVSAGLVNRRADEAALFLSKPAAPVETADDLNTQELSTLTQETT